MNILEMEDMVKGLPDQVLMQYAQFPDPQLPQFLALSEVQRRQDMRQRFQSQQQGMEPTVKDKILQGGIASVGGPPMPPEGMPMAGPPMEQGGPPMGPPQGPPQGMPQGMPMSRGGLTPGGIVYMQQGRQIPSTGSSFRAAPLRMSYPNVMSGQGDPVRELEMIRNMALINGDTETARAANMQLAALSKEGMSAFNPIANAGVVGQMANLAQDKSTGLGFVDPATSLIEPESTAAVEDVTAEAPAPSAGRRGRMPLEGRPEMQFSGKPLRRRGPDTGRQYTQPSAASQATAAPAAPASGEFSLPAARDVSIFSDLRPGTDYSGGTQEREERLGLESFTPSISNFQDVYSRELADRLLKPVTIQSQRATPESVAAASEAARTGFYPQEMERLRKFAPDREKFDKSRQSDLLVGLGSVIAGATQRGDIAKGLAQLADQQREAQREFRREEREYMGLESALRREQRQEERADVRESRAERRADEAIERAEELSARTQAANIAQQVVSGEKDLAELRRDMMLIDIKQQEAQRALAAAVTKEQREQAEMALRNLKTYAEMLKMAIESAGTPGVTQPALFRRLLESGDSMTSASELQSLGR